MYDLRNSRRNRVDCVLTSAKVAELIAELVGVYEHDRGGRRPTDEERRKYVRHMEILLLDLLSAWEGDETKYIGYSRGKPNYTRGGCYWDHVRDQPVLSERIYLELVKFLEGRGFVENHKAKAGYGRFSSRMRAAPRLAEVFGQYGLNWTSVATSPQAEVIFVRNVERSSSLCRSPTSSTCMSPNQT